MVEMQSSPAPPRPPQPPSPHLSSATTRPSSARLMVTFCSTLSWAVTCRAGDKDGCHGSQAKALAADRRQGRGRASPSAQQQIWEQTACHAHPSYASLAGRRSCTKPGHTMPDEQGFASAWPHHQEEAGGGGRHGHRLGCQRGDGGVICLHLLPRHEAHAPHRRLPRLGPQGGAPQQAVGLQAGGGRQGGASGGSGGIRDARDTRKSERLNDRETRHACWRLRRRGSMHPQLPLHCTARACGACMQRVQAATSLGWPRPTLCHHVHAATSSVAIPALPSPPCTRRQCL